MAARRVHGSTGTEGGRRPTGVPVESTIKPDPEVVSRSRRRFTVAYKIKVLETVSALRDQGHGAVGAYLRKEGLYYSSITGWQRQQSQGLLTANRRGPREKSRESLLAEIKQLRRKLEQMNKRIAKTEMIVDLQKKLSSLMETDPLGQLDRSGER